MTPALSASMLWYYNWWMGWQCYCAGRLCFAHALADPELLGNYHLRQLWCGLRQGGPQNSSEKAISSASSALLQPGRNGSSVLACHVWIKTVDQRRQ